MKNFLDSHDSASKGAALIIVLAFVVLLTGVALAYFSRTTTDRQLAQSSYNDISADLLARSALDIVVGDFKQEIINNPTVTRVNIQPIPYPMPTPADIPNLIRYSSQNAAASRASNINSATASANGRSISTTRWNSHYLVPKGDTSSADSSPVPSFTAPDWVLVTGQGPAQAPAPSAVIGRYAFAVYDEGGLLDMNVAGYPNWPDQAGCAAPSATPWLVNVGRKGTVAFADLTALPAAPTTFFPQAQMDNIVGWRNYATTQQPASFFPSGNPNFTADCTRPNFYGSYLLYFGDPPFIIDSDMDKLTASTYPFSTVPNYVSSGRTDQSLMTRQELLKLRSSLGFSQNVLQYMGTFSRERNRPAPDWPNLNPTGALSEGRFNLNNLDMLIPNPDECNVTKGHKGWLTGKNKNHTCGTPTAIVDLFGLFWRKATIVDPVNDPPHAPGHWIYVGQNHLPNPNGKGQVDCFKGPNRQNDFFQILKYALFQVACSGGDTNFGRLTKTFAIGASLIDEWDSGAACPSSGNAGPGQPTGCDLDWHSLALQGSKQKWDKRQYTTHTTVIEWGNGGGNFAYGIEPNYSTDLTNGDWPYDVSGGTDFPHRPCGNNGGLCATGQVPGPTPVTGGPTPTQVVNRGFATVGEFGYGMDTSTAGLPTLDFSDSSSIPPFQYAPVLDFFGYNPISSAYPRAGIVNLYTKNVSVIAAMLKSTLVRDSITSPPASVVSQPDAVTAAQAIVNETQRVLAGSPTYGSVQQTDLTRAIAGRLAKTAADAVSGLNVNSETKNTVARALAEMGQTRTWNLLIDA